MTGSPDGRPVDQERGWVQPGSIVEGSIKGVGTVTAQVVEETG
jgi:2-keto-4-pentenoate hydratase/2-oxohepta-3-ene-1,7-dioic acid hydratase in catechol pathway